MRSIKKIKWNGYNVVSTFSGAGGSCLGFRMAGFRVLWANEFVESAESVYKLNHPSSIVDNRDIRQVSAEDILAATGLSVGELDVLEGSPPCASFSTAGRRQKVWGEVRKYSEREQVVDDLFFEFSRILRGLKPKTFVAENVSGLVKGASKGYFKMIFKDLEDCGYKVKARKLDAQWLGIPQMRERIIFVGARDDLGIEPAHPTPLPYRYTVADVLPYIERICDKEARYVTPDRPHRTIMQSDALRGDTAAFSATGWVQAHPPTDKALRKRILGDSNDNMRLGAASLDLFKRKFSIPELKILCAFPSDFILVGDFAQRWERLGRAVPPLMMKKIAETIRDRMLGDLDGAV